MKTWAGWMLIMTAGLLWAEDAPDPAKIPLEKAIMPRAEGAEWHYTSFWFDEGRLKSSGSVVEEVLERISVDGVDSYKIKRTFDFRTLTERLSGMLATEDTVDTFWEFSEEKGVRSLGRWGFEDVPAPSSLKPFQLLFPYPTKKGHTYKVGEVTWKVLDETREVTVPVGSFKCVVYQSVHTTGNEEHWSRDRVYLAPGTGLVKMEIDAYRNGKWVLDTWDELVSFTLPGRKVSSD